MARLQLELVLALLFISTMCFSEVHMVCFGDNGDLCFDNDLPCWEETFDMFPGDPDTLGNHFFLYNRDIIGTGRCKDATPEELAWSDASSLDGGFDAQLKTVVIVHGFRSNILDDFITRQCDTFLDVFEVNVIMVDWEEAARGVNYLQSRQDARLIGRELGLLLELLHNVKDLQYADVHIVGHSLGAHLAGFTGEYLNGQIGRITGLDPAGPYFRGFINEPRCSLDKSDAQFVDIIHSDGSAYVYGKEEQIGHQDFYPNRGCAWQPDCFLKFACSHMRAIDIFIASLKNFADPSQGCYYPTTPYDSGLCGPGTGQECPVMGILAGDGPDGKFYTVDDDCY